MAEYIDREATVGLLENKYQDMSAMPASYYAGFQYALNMLKQIPSAADVAPVVHGRWVKPVPGDGENYCSVCKAEQSWFYGYGYFEPDYCPNCGARMDGEQK